MGDDIALISFSLLVLYFHSRGNLEKNVERKDLKTPRTVIFFFQFIHKPQIFNSQGSF